jgi:hypothetical protein
MWHFPRAFKCFPFLCGLMMSIISVMVPYLYPMFIMWFEYPELILIFLIDCICSCIWCGMLCLFVLCILAGSQNVSFCRCQFYCICPFVGVVSPSFVLCSVFDGYFCLRVFKQSCYSSCFFSTVCESSPFLFPALWVGVCILPLWGWIFLFLTLKPLLCEGANGWSRKWQWTQYLCNLLRNRW